MFSKTKKVEPTVLPKKEKEEMFMLSLHVSNVCPKQVDDLCAALRTLPDCVFYSSNGKDSVSCNYRTSSPYALMKCIISADVERYIVAPNGQLPSKSVALVCVPESVIQQQAGRAPSPQVGAQFVR